MRQPAGAFPKQFAVSVMTPALKICDLYLVTVVQFEPSAQHTSVRTDFVCRNQHGKDVMSGYAQGVIKASSL